MSLSDDDLVGPGEPDSSASVVALTAAHQVLNGSRQATRLELLLSTAVEVLARAPHGLDSLADELRRVWPEAGVSEEDAAQVLALGSSSQVAVFRRVDSLDGALWRLDENGRTEAQLAAEWMAGVRRRAVDDLHDRASSDYRQINEREARLWVDRLTDALAKAVVAGEESLLGDVQVVGRNVQPGNFDRAVLESGLASPDNPEVSEFLVACALAALDPSEPFGNEIVSVLVTSQVLHGHIARLDIADSQRLLGGLHDQEALLDTPVLLGLISDEETRTPLERMIRAAVASGIGVIAAEHYLEELADLVVSRQDLAEAEADLLRDPRTRATFVALTASDDVVSTYAKLLDEGSVEGWAAFQHLVGGLRARLGEMGVEVRPHGNSDPAQVELGAVALRKALEDAGRRRARHAIERDAQTLSMALRHRGRFRRYHPAAAFPGLWVVTMDRRLANAYAQMDPEEREPLTLTPSRFTLLVARASPVPEVASLAEAAGRLLRREIADRVAIRYPPDVAAELADALSGAGGRTDVRVAQFASVAHVLENAEAHDVTAEVLKRRMARMRSAQVRDHHMADEERTAASDRIVAAQRARSDAESRTSLARDDADRARAEADYLRTELGRAPTAVDIERRQRRSTVRTTVLVLTCVAALWAGSDRRWLPAVLFAAGAVLFWLQTRSWVEDLQVRLRTAIVGIIADTAAVLVVVGDVVARALSDR